MFQRMDDKLDDGLATDIGEAMSAADADEGRNCLESAASAYLQSARLQPVHWMEWGEAAFERARKEDRPILLDIGAVWCHWCHVMDRESYEDSTTAQIINANFVAVKVDRDERPDVDTRYQAAISAISGQGGWPLTAFLTPDGKPYFGGTYFPPEDRHSRPGFQRVLLTMAEAFANRRDEVNESAASVIDAIEHNESFSGHVENPGPDLVERIAIAGLKMADLRHGGFGGQPKFPHSAGLDLLTDIASRPGTKSVKIGQTVVPLAEAAKRVVNLSLEKMAKGGICDQLAGGFHRYSIDEHWLVPHFEKMSYDNSELLRVYVHAYQSFGDEQFARVARDIMRWMDEWLSDREHGGFYASQDADCSLDDDGDYFTWTLDEAADVLTAEELAVAAPFYDIGEIGDMQHNPARNVLHVKHSLDAVARRAHLENVKAGALLDLARQKLYAARLRRPCPYIDKTIYTGWNAMCVSAYLEASRVLQMPLAREFALRSLDRSLSTLDETGGVPHVLVYGNSLAGKIHIPGGLDDYVFLGHASVDAWEVTGDIRYFEAAARLAESVIARFHDAAGSAFCDTEQTTQQKLGALIAKRKPLQDSPTPAGNPTAAALLMRVAELSGRFDYIEMAQSTLETFAGVVEHFGLYASSYARALQRLVREPIQICVIGNDDMADQLEAAALRTFSVNKSVVRIKRLGDAGLPPVLETTLTRLPKIEESFALVCSGHTCQPPIRSADHLLSILSASA